MEGNAGCCGADFGPPEVSLLHVLVKSTPYVVLYGISLPILLAIRKVLPPVARTMGSLDAKFTKCMEDIGKTRLLQKQKCVISGKLFIVSPAVAGAFFRFFNLIVLGSIWLALLGIVAALGILVK